MKEPIQKPINIPGRRKVLTKNRILESQKHTKSNMEAARWLEVNYNTYKKWAKYYGVFEQHLNQKGVGIKKVLVNIELMLKILYWEKENHQKGGLIKW